MCHPWFTICLFILGLWICRPSHTLPILMRKHPLLSLGGSFSRQVIFLLFSSRVFFVLLQFLLWCSFLPASLCVYPTWSFFGLLTYFSLSRTWHSCGNCSSLSVRLSFKYSLSFHLLCSCSPFAGVLALFISPPQHIFFWDSPVGGGRSGLALAALRDPEKNERFSFAISEKSCSQDTLEGALCWPQDYGHSGQDLTIFPLLFWSLWWEITPVCLGAAVCTEPMQRLWGGSQRYKSIETPFFVSQTLPHLLLPDAGLWVHLRKLRVGFPWTVGCSEVQDPSVSPFMTQFLEGVSETSPIG